MSTLVYIAHFIITVSSNSFICNFIGAEGMLCCNLAMYHLAVCQKSHSKLKIPFRQHWLSNNMPVYSPIMLALCSMLLVTYYASNYASIIGLGLMI